MFVYTGLSHIRMDKLVDKLVESFILGAKSLILHAFLIAKPVDNKQAKKAS